MKQPTRRDLEVFEFRDSHEEEQVNFRLATKYANPKFDDSPSTKYQFLHCVAQGPGIEAKKISVPQCVDVDDSDDDDRCSTDVLAPAPEDVRLRDSMPCQLARNEAIEGSTVEHCCKLDVDINDCDNTISCTTPGAKATVENGPISNPPIESPTNSGLINATSSDAVDSNKDNSPSPHTPLQTENSEGCTKDDMLSGFMMVDAELTVPLQADYIAYQDKYYPASLIIFSQSCIRVEGLDANQDVETFISQWGIDDIFSLEFQWCPRVNVVRGQLIVLAKGSMQDDTVQNASGLEEIKFAVYDPQWNSNQEKLMSLNNRYRALWKIVPLSVDFDGGDALSIGKGELFSREKAYFPDFDQHFDEVIYPEGDVDAVSITKRDVDLLQPETFINDTIIDFYIKFLMNKIAPEDKNRFHFFNSFFFRKLADLDKNPDSAFDGKAAFQRVRKWTRKLNLFEKDYIFIPVNYNLHWSLIVICHPGEVADFGGGDMNESSKVPCILHMDSIRGSHSGLKNLVQSYLYEEWKERQKDTPEDNSMMFSNLRFLSLELPQQENCYDCGLFLLHYVEFFVADAPRNFNPFTINKFSNFLTADWFMPAEVSLKRAHIRRLICELLKKRSQGGHLSGASEELDTSMSQKNSGTDHDAVSLSADNGSALNFSPMNTCYSGSNQVIDVSLLGLSSFKTSPCISQPGFFEPGTSSVLLFGQYQQNDVGPSYGQHRGAMSPIEEEEEADEHIVYSPNASNFRPPRFSSEGCNDLELLENQHAWVEAEEEEEEEEDNDENEEEEYNNDYNEEEEDNNDDNEEGEDNNDDNEEGEDNNDDNEEEEQEEEERNSDQEELQELGNSSDQSGLHSENENLELIEDCFQSRGEAHRPQAEKQDPSQSCPLIDNLDSLDDTFASASSDSMETPADDYQQISEGADENRVSDLGPSNGDEGEVHFDQEEPKEGYRVGGEEQDLDGALKSGKVESVATRVEELVGRRPKRVKPGDENQKGPREDEELIVCDSSSDSEEPQSAKRLKLSPVNAGMKLTGSLFKGVPL